MSEDLGSMVIKLAMENTSFDEGIRNLNRQLRVIQSDFKNSVSGIKDYGTNLDALKAKKEMLSKSISTQSTIVNKYREGLNTSKKTLTDTANEQVKLNEKIKLAEKAYEDSKESLGSNAEETKKLKKDLDDLNKEHEKNEAKIRNAQKAIDNYNVKINSAENKLKSMKNELDKTSSSIDLQESKWTKLSNKLKTLHTSLDTVSKKMSTVGKNLTMSLSAPIAAIGGLSAKLGMDFEASMSQVQAISGASASELKQLEEAARNAGSSTSKSAKDAADALNYMSLAGWDVKTSMDSLMPVLRLSEAGNLDLARASDLVTDSMSALGKGSNKLSTYLDQVSKTSTITNTNIDMLMEAFIETGGMAKTLKVDTSELSATLGVLANAGYKG